MKNAAAKQIQKKINGRQAKPFFYQPVGCIIFRSTGNVLRIICKFVLLDFRLQIFGLGSAGTRTWSVTAFAVKLLLLWFVARGGSRIRVLSQLQKALVSLLVLPVCEDLRGR